MLGSSLDDVIIVVFSSTQECLRNVCHCANGVGALGTDCPKHRSQACVGCDAAFTLTRTNNTPAALCLPNRCVCDDGDAAVGEQCPENGAPLCRRCNDGFYLDGTHRCRENICTCKNGHAFKGVDCPKHDMELCQQCLELFVITADKTCTPHPCDCNNGKPAPPGSCGHLPEGVAPPPPEAVEKVRQREAKQKSDEKDRQGAEKARKLAVLAEKKAKTADMYAKGASSKKDSAQSERGEKAQRARDAADESLEASASAHVHAKRAIAAFHAMQKNKTIGETGKADGEVVLKTGGGPEDKADQEAVSSAMEITSDGSSVIDVLGDGDHQIIDSEISSAQSLRTQTEELQEKDSPRKLEPSSFLYLRQDLHTVLEEDHVVEHFTSQDAITYLNELAESARSWSTLVEEEDADFANGFATALEAAAEHRIEQADSEPTTAPDEEEGADEGGTPAADEGGTPAADEGGTPAPKIESKTTYLSAQMARVRRPIFRSSPHSISTAAQTFFGWRRFLWRSLLDR